MLGQRLDVHRSLKLYPGTGGHGWQLRQLGGVNQNLGRNAANVQTCSADGISLDQNHGLAEPSATQRGGIPARPATDNKNIGGRGNLTYDHL